ncbi:MAG TPA: hypothetical protein PLA96_14045 [Candidatus Brocadia sapporoensis]|nr:hypothetical protein [Candidatus Brocadia sapporoensis]
MDREEKGRSCIGIFILFQRVSGWHGQTRLSMLFESMHGLELCHTDKQGLSVPPDKPVKQVDIPGPLGRHEGL